jgi:hypothetical protein
MRLLITMVLLLVQAAAISLLIIKGFEDGHILLCMAAIAVTWMFQRQMGIQFGGISLEQQSGRSSSREARQGSACPQRSGQKLAGKTKVAFPPLKRKSSETPGSSSEKPWVKRIPPQRHRWN